MDVLHWESRYSLSCLRPQLPSFEGAEVLLSGASLPDCLTLLLGEPLPVAPDPPGCEARATPRGHYNFSQALGQMSDHTRYQGNVVGHAQHNTF